MVIVHSLQAKGYVATWKFLESHFHGEAKYFLVLKGRNEIFGRVIIFKFNPFFKAQLTTFL